VTAVARILATGFGIGWFPKAPGTVASLVALPFGCWLAFVGDWQGVLGAAIVASFLGVWVCGAYAGAIGVSDPGECVLDEIAGQWFAMVPLPFMGHAGNLSGLALAFALFRFFDIVKPWPISRLERLPGGLGIMADDILAGLVSEALLAFVITKGWI
jgi:phosphatidylglycerophosphatase A